MSNKETYKILCETEGENIPLFLQYWWWSIVAQGKQWDVALAYDKNNHLQAAMPYIVGKRFGMKYVLQPQLTQYAGPWYRYEDNANASQRWTMEQEATKQLVEQIFLYRPTLIVQKCSPAVTNWQPFYECGFTQTTCYTYQISDISNMATMLDNMQPNRRHKIEKWSSSVTPEVFDDAEWMATFHQKYWQSKGYKDLLSHTLIKSVCHQSTQRGNGLMLRLRDNEGRYVSAGLAVYDSKSAYMLLSAHDMSLHQNWHAAMLIWNIIGVLSSRTKAFDFEGSMIPGKAYFNQSFGAVQTPYSQLTYFTHPLVRWALRRKI